MVRALRPLIADAMREQLAAEARAVETPEPEEPHDPADEAASEAIHAEMNRWMADRLPELADPPSTNGPKGQGSGVRNQERGYAVNKRPSVRVRTSRRAGRQRAARRRPVTKRPFPRRQRRLSRRAVNKRPFSAA